MEIKRFSPEIVLLLQEINKKSVLNVFFHELEGCFLEVQTDLKSPYLFFEIEISSNRGERINGKIVKILLIQGEEMEELYCGDLSSWHLGLNVVVHINLDGSGTMEQ